MTDEEKRRQIEKDVLFGTRYCTPSRELTYLKNLCDTRVPIYKTYFAAAKLVDGTQSDTPLFF